MPKQTHRVPGGHPLSKGRRILWQSELAAIESELGRPLTDRERDGVRVVRDIGESAWSAMALAIGRRLTDRERAIVSDCVRLHAAFIADQRLAPSVDDVKVSLLGLASMTAPALILKAYHDSAPNVNMEITEAMLRDGVYTTEPSAAEIARYAQAAFDYLRANPKARRKGRRDPAAILAHVIWRWWSEFGMAPPAKVSEAAPIVRFAKVVFDTVGANVSAAAVKTRMQRAQKSVEII